MTTPSRIVTPERHGEDAPDTALRPQVLSDFVGQAQARKNLSIFNEAARKSALLQEWEPATRDGAT